MLRRGLIAALVAAAMAVAVQVASADPGNAKNSATAIAVCNGQQVGVTLNGNGNFTPGHVTGSTSNFVPTAIDVTFSFTPTGGTTETNTTDVSHSTTHANEITCDLPAALNTFTSPEGTTTLEGTVTGFFTPSKK